MRNLPGILVAVVAGLAASSAVAQLGKPPLTMASFGGAFTRSQMMGYVEPWRQARERWMTVVDYDGGLDEVRAQVRSANVTWDLVSMELPDAMEGCAEGLLAPIDPTILAPAPDGTPARQDFFEVALQPCAIGFDIFATVVAYDARRFPAPPTTLGDFFDLDRFPGSRALQARPQVNLEWALIADGVPPGEVYATLETEEGLDRAFAVLDRIRDQVVWWRFGAQPPELLANGQVAMASAWNGRIFQEVEARGTPLGIVWDHQVWNMDVWTTPVGAPNPTEALDFIAFATAPERIAAQTSLIAYGPARRSASALVAPEVRAQLPTAEGRRAGALTIDHQWWAANQDHLQARFATWLRRGELSVYDEVFGRGDAN